MPTPLTEQRCHEPPSGSPPMSESEAAPLLTQLDGWTIERGTRLVKSYTFPNYVAAVDFVNKITPLAETDGHHPDLELGWGRVRIALSTHITGGLSLCDFILAAKIDRLEA